VRTVRPGVLEWGRERARTGPWRGDRRTAFLSPYGEETPPTTGFLRRCLDALGESGFQTVVTSALTPPQQRPFFDVGFEEQEQLHLLLHDLTDIPATPASTARLGRTPRRLRPDVLDLDALAFSPFWQLDKEGLGEAMAATRRAHLCVARPAHGAPAPRIVGYSLAGLTSSTGYLQRLATHPDWRRQGVARALVVDALRWMRRRRAGQATVNTQFGNDAAMGLYLGLGFRLQPSTLAVLRRTLTE